MMRDSGLEEERRLCARRGEDVYRGKEGNEERYVRGRWRGGVGQLFSSRV